MLQQLSISLFILPNCYCNFSQMKSYCSSSLNKKLYPAPFFFFLLSFPQSALSLFPFFLLFSPLFSSPLSSLLCWSSDLSLGWSSISAWVERRSRPMVERRWSRPWWSVDLTSQERRDEERDGDGFVELLEFLELLVGSPPADWGWF